MANRFDYVKYDDYATRIQGDFKNAFIGIEGLVASALGSERWREACLMKLEEAYMCVGKAIRDDQIARNGSAPLQEERGDK